MTETKSIAIANWDKFNPIQANVVEYVDDPSKKWLVILWPDWKPIWQKLRDITKEPTGFTDPENIIVTYNSTDRTVTLTGNIEAYYKWKKIPELVSWWTSDQHADTHWTFFLHYCDTWFIFDTSPWTFDCLQIAFAQSNSYKIGIRECHWFMQRQSHKEFHETVGTYRSSGWDFSDYTTGSTTIADRRPNIASLVVYDEDLKSNIPLLNTKKYTHRYLSWAGVRTFDIQQNDFIKQNWTVARYNRFSLGVRDFADIPNNNYAAIFVVWIPATSDSWSQEYRYMFVQPQQFGSLAQIQALTPNNLNHWDTMMLVSEFVFFGKIIIQTAWNNWTIYSVELLTSTRVNQVSTWWNFLSIVNTNTTLIGDWTAWNPLWVDTTKFLLLDQTTKQALTTSPIFWNLTAGRILFANTDKSLTDDTEFRRDNTNKRFLLWDAYSSISGSFNMKFGITVNTNLISWMDFKNSNSAGQVRLLARNNQGDYLVMNTFGSTNTASLFGYNGNNISSIFQQATTDIDKKLVIWTINAGELVFATRNLHKLIIGDWAVANIKMISNSTTAGTSCNFSFLMTTSPATVPTVWIRGIRNTVFAESDFAIFTNSLNRLYINWRNGYMSVWHSSPLYPLDVYANTTWTIWFFKGSWSWAIALDSNSSDSVIHTYNGSSYTPLILRAKAGNDGWIYIATTGKVWIWLTNGTKLFEVKWTAWYNACTDMWTDDNDFVCKKYVDDIVNAAIKLQWDWDADSNDPDISSETETGYSWRVSVAWTTDLWWIDDWDVWDLAIKTDSGWLKVWSWDINLNRWDILWTITDQVDLTNRINSLASVYESKGSNNAVNVSDGAGKWKDSWFVISDFLPTQVKNSIEKDTDDKLQLKWDESSPWTWKYYWTNNDWTKWFHTLPSPSVSTKNSIQSNEDWTIDLFWDEESPWWNKYYWTNSTGTKWFHSISKDCVIKYHFLLWNSFNCYDMTGVAINSWTLWTVNNVPNHPWVTQMRASWTTNSWYYFRTWTSAIPMSTWKHTWTFIIRPDNDAVTTIARFGFQTWLTVSESWNSVWLNTVWDDAGNVVVSWKQRNVSTETTATSYTLAIWTWVTWMVVIDSVSNTITFTLHNDSWTQLRTDTLTLNTTIKANANFFWVVAVGRSSVNIVSIDYFDYCVEWLTAYYW